MATTLLTDAQVTSLETLFDMGRVWEGAEDSEQILAIRTVEAAWKTLPWVTSPFTDSDLAARLQYVAARAARYVLENEGSQGTESKEIQRLLMPYLAGRRAVSMGLTSSTSRSTSNATVTLTGTQIVALIDGALGGTGWRTGSGGGSSLTGGEIVSLINGELGNSQWQSGGNLRWGE